MLVRREELPGDDAGKEALVSLPAVDLRASARQPRFRTDTRHPYGNAVLINTKNGLGFYSRSPMAHG